MMLGYMNAEALERTQETREAHFWSRSREAVWRKGEHSGFTQAVEHILVLQVRVNGPGSCHVGFRSCFYREVDLEAAVHASPIRLRRIEGAAAFDASAVYAGLPNPTRL